MLLFRSLTVGLLAACAYMLADLPAAHTHTIRTVQVTQPAVRPHPNLNHNHDQVTVVDVAHGFAPANIHSLLLLQQGESVVAINDRRIAAVEVVTEIVDTVDFGARYLDLTVWGGHGTRRILVLLH
jgi:hypothetical protein